MHADKNMTDDSFDEADNMEEELLDETPGGDTVLSKRNQIELDQVTPSKQVDMKKLRRSANTESEPHSTSFDNQSSMQQSTTHVIKLNAEKKTTLCEDLELDDQQNHSRKISKIHSRLPE